MKNLFLLGGGEIKYGETFEMDTYIKNISNGSSILFIPTASGDSQGYIDTFTTYFKEKVGYHVVEVLKLSKNSGLEEMKNKIVKADVIYVGGGNTRKMLKIRNETGLDQLLIEIYNTTNKWIGGLSAGAICWANKGVSDSSKIDNGKDNDYILLNGLGLIDYIISPHQIREPDRLFFLKSMISEHKEKVGIAIDDNAGLLFEDGKLSQVINSNKEAIVTKVKNELGKIKESILSL